MPRWRWLGATAKSLIPPGACRLLVRRRPHGEAHQAPAVLGHAGQGGVEPGIVEEQVAHLSGSQAIVYQGLAQQVARPREILRGEMARRASLPHGWAPIRITV